MILCFCVSFFLKNVSIKIKICTFIDNHTAPQACARIKRWTQTSRQVGGRQLRASTLFKPKQVSRFACMQIYSIYNVLPWSFWNDSLAFIKNSNTNTPPRFKPEQMRPVYLDQVEDDDRGPEALQHLVEMEASDVGVRVGLIHWGRN